jgi:hypothetical protein
MLQRIDGMLPEMNHGYKALRLAGMAFQEGTILAKGNLL